MDRLQSLGLRIDDDENLKIISAEAEMASLELSTNVKLILAGLNDLKKSLDETSKLIETLNRQAGEVRFAKLCHQISKLKRSSRPY